MQKGRPLQEEASSKLNPAQIPMKVILYATDFSRQSETALPYALSMAHRYDSRLVVAHVISMFPFPKFSPTTTLQSISAQALRESQEAMAVLDRQLEGVPHKILIRKGDISGELAAIIKEENVSLTVLGTHGRSGASKILIGSVAETLFRQLPCPALTVGPNAAGESDNIADLHAILCPVDFSPESFAALPYAISLAQQHGARLYLFHAAEEPFTKMEERDLEKRLLNLVRTEGELYCCPKVYIASGSAADGILAMIEELALDLVVLGVKRVPNLPIGPARLRMGTAYKIVTQATCPILTVGNAHPG